MTAPGAPPTRAAALMIGCALGGFDAGAVGYVLPALRAATGADAATASWLVSAYVVGLLVGIPLAGGAAGRFGAASLFRGCLALALGGAALALLTDSIVALLVARVLQGLGQGPLLPLAATLVAQHWPVERQGRLVGALSLAYGAAFLAATVVTPPLLELGWRASFVLSMAAAAAALLAARGRAASAPAAQVVLDAPPTPQGGAEAGAGPGPPAHQPSPALAGLRGLWTGEMAAIGVLSLGTGIGQAMLVWFPTLAIVRLGVSTAATSLLMLPLVVGGIAATLAITVWLDRLGARRLLAIGAVATLLGLLVALLVAPSRMAFMVGAGLFGLGIVGLCGGPLRYAAARAISASGQGLAQSAVALLTNVGLLAGNIVLGALASAGRDDRSGTETALLTTGALMVASFAALWALRPHDRRVADAIIVSSNPPRADR
jgi:MFS family permease